jgi:hydroxyacylglutathione hydrolase
LGYEFAANRALAAASGDVDAFVAYILEGQPEPPLYFARMKRDNKLGPQVLGKLPVPKPISAAKLLELERATGVALIDTRAWDAYRRAHVPGSLFVPLDRSFNTTAGCYVPEAMPIYLIVNEARLREAVVDLVHVGLDRIVGYATPSTFDEYARKGRPASIAEIEPSDIEARVGQGAFLLDVRRLAELSETGRIPGSNHIAHTRLLEHVGELPKDRPVLVYCRTGRRSAYASALLDRLGYRATNVAGGFEAWKSKGGVAATT